MFREWRARSELSFRAARAIAFLAVLWLIVAAAPWSLLLTAVVLVVVVLRRRSRAARAARLTVASNLQGLLSLTPGEFEQTVGVILTASGYHGVRVAGRTGDRGVDLRCIDPRGRPTIVQCKQYSSRRVGGPEVRNLIGARHQDGAQHAILATTSTFTSEALAAAATGGLHLLNGWELATMASRARGTPR